MKKILILSIGDLRHISMISMYTKLLNDNGMVYDIICTSRYSDEKTSKSNLYEFYWHQNMNAPKILKIRPFIKFRKFAKKLINKNKYDFIIVWNENTALLFFDLLLITYTKKYCVNIRDFGFFRSTYLKSIVTKLLKNSAFSTFPSPWGLEHLPVFDYTIMLNYDYDLVNKFKVRDSLKKTDKITITYLGVIFNTNYKRIITELGNDGRFLLEYYGPGIEELEIFVKTNNYSNVVFGPEFPVHKTSDYLRNTDIINSYYGNNFIELKYAHGVKQSYAPIFHIPIILDSDTKFGIEAEKFGFGFQIDKKTPFKEELYNWYMTIDENSFHKLCSEYVSKIEETNLDFKRKFDEYIL